MFYFLVCSLTRLKNKLSRKYHSLTTELTNDQKYSHNNRDTIWWESKIARINETEVRPVLRRPVLSQVVQQAEVKTWLIDDCSVKLGRVARVQSGFSGRDSTVLLYIRQRTIMNLFVVFVIIFTKGTHLQQRALLVQGESGMCFMSHWNTGDDDLKKKINYC